MARLVMAQPDTRLIVLAEPRVLSCPADMHQNELAEMFDKYNLHALPVVDHQGRMVGVVQAEHVISFLREKNLNIHQAYRLPILIVFIKSHRLHQATLRGDPASVPR